MRREPWGKTAQGMTAELITLINSAGTIASVAAYGATLVRWMHGLRQWAASTTASR